jgi:hypothetical protein
MAITIAPGRWPVKVSGRAPVVRRPPLGYRYPAAAMLDWTALSVASDGYPATMAPS